MDRFVDSSQGLRDFYFSVKCELRSWENQFRGLQRMGFNLINLNRESCMRSTSRESVMTDATFYGPRNGGTECFHPLNVLAEE
jgi:hypothetical protein